MCDCLIVSFDYDCTKKDETVLAVGRKHGGGSIDVLNIIQGDEANEIYCKLVGSIGNENEV